MSNVQVKEDFSHHTTAVVFGMLSAVLFPSILVPNIPPFVPVTFDGISSVVNTGQIAVIFPQSSDLMPSLYIFSSLL